VQQFLLAGTNLDPTRRIIVAGATALMFIAILSLARVANKPAMALLYSGLEPVVAGEVVQSLEAEGAQYEVRGAAIFVEAAQRDQLRMTLATAGLPSNSTNGYELLDMLSGFGTTSQMFDATYWRAKEGELARTIMAAPHVRAARVHIANASSRPFQSQFTTTASVAVTSSGGSVSSAQAKAYRFLVASAVAGLDVKNVTVIDARSGTVLAHDDLAQSRGGNSERAQMIRDNIERLLEARVGIGRAIVEVSVETTSESESIVERRFDPNERVVISSQTEETSNNSQDQGAGAVTVASNLPEGDGAAGRTSNANTSETRESLNYEVSETRREVQRLPGEIKRMSVAVLVDGLRTIDATTEVENWTPRSEEELADLRALVASAAGFEEARGDIITIRSMEFEPIEIAGTEVTSSFISSLPIDLFSVARLLILSLLTLGLGMFVVRPILAKGTARPEAIPALPGATTAQAPNAIPVPDLPDLGMGAPGGDMGGGFELPNLGVVSDFDLGEDDIGPGADPVKRLKKMIEERHDETVEVLRGWMEESETAR